MNGNWWRIRDEIGSVRLDQKETPMSKSVLLSSVLLSGSLCFVGVQLGKARSPVVESNAVSHVEAVNVSGPSEPYVVEYDFITTIKGGTGSSGFTSGLVALRIWSDGLIEQKNWTISSNNNSPYCPREAESCDSGWIPLPGSSDGYACRSDIDGDRQVDFDDLLMVINDWSQPAICNPHPEIECGKPPFQPPA